MRTNRFNTGKAFEKLIEAIAVQYASKKLLRLRKVDPPVRYAGGRMIPMENPFTDYVGVWTERDGRAVFIEAKSTRDPVLPLSHLTDKQVAAMHAWRVAGAAVLLLWECGGVVRFWTEPMISDQTIHKRHLKFNDGFIVPTGMGWVTHDFLESMREIWTQRAHATTV